jgi:hypothetical protein
MVEQKVIVEYGAKDNASKTIKGVEGSVNSLANTLKSFIGAYVGKEIFLKIKLFVFQ